MKVHAPSALLAGAVLTFGIAAFANLLLPAPGAPRVENASRAGAACRGDCGRLRDPAASLTGPRRCAGFRSRPKHSECNFAASPAEILPGDTEPVHLRYAADDKPHGSVSFAEPSSEQPSVDSAS